MTAPHRCSRRHDRPAPAPEPVVVAVQLEPERAPSRRTLLMTSREVTRVLNRLHDSGDWEGITIICRMSPDELELLARREAADPRGGDSSGA